jgi:hypothetical protein
MSIARLVRFESPGAVDTPLLLLAELREIDPTVELMYAGDGRWWLGAVSDNHERRRRAEIMIAQITALEKQRQAARTLMLAHLNLQGFALIETYHGRDPRGTMLVNPGPDEYRCTIVEDFRERDAAWRKDQGKAKFTERLLASMKEPERLEGEARMKEYLATDGRDHYRREMRNRITVGGGADYAQAYDASQSVLILPDSF